MNAYTGMLSWDSVRSTWQQVKLSRLARVVGVLLISGVAILLALLGWRSFVTTFSNFLDVLLFVFVPWSLINLVDFYWVQRERYDVAAFYTPRGIYGGWRWVAVIPYLIALGVELLFVDQTDLKGPLVNAARRRRHLLDRRRGSGRRRIPDRGPHRRPGRRGAHGAAD